MARPGISYQDVATAAQQLVAAEKQPTIENIRIMLGTGSHSTIASHLRAWKNHQDSNHLTATKENLPDELLGILKGLWERVMDTAGDKIQMIQEEAAQQINELKTEVIRLQKENAYWQEQYQQLKALKDVLENERAVQNEAIKHLEVEQIALLVTQTNLNQQLGDKQARIDELLKLHEQSQTNLVHYREVVESQLRNDLQRQQQAVAEQEKMVKSSTEQLAIALKDNNDLRVEITQLKTSNTYLQQHNKQLLSLIDKPYEQKA